MSSGADANRYLLQRVITKTYQDHCGFTVCTESFSPKGVDAARYIGRYLGHPPPAISPLTDYDGKHIAFWSKEAETRGKKQDFTCPEEDEGAWL
jgi:hypothetical protein